MKRSLEQCFAFVISRELVKNGRPFSAQAFVAGMNAQEKRSSEVTDSEFPAPQNIAISLHSQRRLFVTYSNNDERDVIVHYFATVKRQQS